MFYAYFFGGLALIALGTFNLMKIKKMGKVEGTVAEYEQDFLAGYTRYKPIITYVVNGKAYKLFTRFKPSVEKKFEGKKFVVYYDTNNPTRARVGTQYQGIAFVAIGVVLFFLSFKLIGR